MKKIIAIIEKGEDGGYSIYAAADDVPVVGGGDTEQEARDDFEAVLHEQAAYIESRTGVRPSWYGGNVEIEYRYDMSAFFKSFPFINASELAKELNINPSLMRKYKSGIVKAGDKQKDLIQRKFDEILSRLSVVKF